MQITEHFTLTEFTRSATADKYGIDNTLDPHNPAHAAIIANLRNLCEQVLEPLRAFVGQPICIGSGYRCPTLNKAVGGVSNSQHMTGEACDIHFPDEATGKRWFTWMMDNLKFDQFIWEKSTPSSTHHWIHVSFSKTHCRQQVIQNLIKSK